MENLSVISPLYHEEGKFFNLKYSKTINMRLKKSIEKFHESISSDKKPMPTFYDIYMFRGLKSKIYTSDVDYMYWEKKGWLESDYYYKTQLNPLKWLFGKLIDVIIAMIVKKVVSQKENARETI